jgi:hypothetical protein
MWLCPHCEAWVGRKLDECAEGHPRPLLPVWSGLVDADDSRQVTTRQRLRAKVRGVRL